MGVGEYWTCVGQYRIRTATAYASRTYTASYDARRRRIAGVARAGNAERAPPLARDPAPPVQLPPAW
eukprot:911420-Rhodomonas_salina.2